MFANTGCSIVIVAVPRTPFGAVAITRAVPAASPVITPLASTLIRVASAGSTLHVNVVGTMVLPPSRAVPNTCVWKPAGIDAPLTLTVAMSPAALTVRMAVPVTPFSARALIVAVPATTPVAMPEVGLIVAINGSLLDHANVVLTVVPSASRDRAMKARVDPTATAAGFGVTVTVTTGPPGCPPPQRLGAV